jgi:hypothetical protein
MLKKPVGIFLILTGFMIANCVQAVADVELRAYIQKNYPYKLQISEEQIQQLSWVMGHVRRSYDMDMQAVDNGVHIEIVRALTRMYCLQLLRSGTADDYTKFIAAQLDANANSSLTFCSFKKLSKLIQALNALDYELLETATILSAVSLSAEAAKLAQNMLNVDNISNDNLTFLVATIRADQNIYPLIKQITSDKERARKLLYILFPPQTNFRHMLYTEGGIGMFKNLRTMIQHQYVNADEINLWYAYWVINIAGFRGHIAQNGSLYLTEPVYQAMTTLKTLIDNMFASPNYNPLIPYLEYRAGLLGFANMPQQEKLLLAHLGCLMRLYNVEDGNRLLTGYYLLSRYEKKELLVIFAAQLNDSALITSTYLPALFGNTMALNGGDIKQTVLLTIPLYIHATKLYNQMQVNGEIKVGVALSFNLSSASKNIRKIINGVDSISKIKIMPDGEVII